MTPKEKATELVNKFSSVGLQVRDEGVACALIAVDEIINLDDFSIEGREYWKQVKQEIENL